MAEKVVIEAGLIADMVDRMNRKVINLGGLEQETGINRRALTRRISEAGYKYDKTTSSYIYDGSQSSTAVKTVTNKVVNHSKEVAIDKEPISNVSEITEKAIQEFKKEKLETIVSSAVSKAKNKVGRPQIHEKNEEGKKVNLKKLTLEIDIEVYKALQVKKITEGFTINKFIEDLLKDNIEEKYYL